MPAHVGRAEGVDRRDLLTAGGGASDPGLASAGRLIASTGAGVVGAVICMILSSGRYSMLLPAFWSTMILLLLVMISCNASR